MAESRIIVTKMSSIVVDENGLETFLTMRCVGICCRFLIWGFLLHWSTHLAIGCDVPPGIIARIACTLSHVLLWKRLHVSVTWHDGVPDDSSEHGLKIWSRSERIATVLLMRSSHESKATNIFLQVAVLVVQPETVVLGALIILLILGSEC
jgi:hypothetical protein